MSENGWTLARDGAVALLTFDQPDKLNALTKAQMIGFGEICRTLGEDAAVRCIVIGGEGRGFCSGADVRGQKTQAASSFAQPNRFKDTRLDFITPLVDCPKPTIAAINGIAVGAGMGIALACDIRICGESGAFLPNFVDLGLPAIDGVPWLLSRLVGVSRALEMLYTADRIDARQAAAAGIVNRVVADGDLQAEALALARRVAAKPPVAIQATRAAVVNGFGKSWSEALVQQELAYVTTVAFAPHDIGEAIIARAERRAPVFTDHIPFDPDPPKES